MGNPNYAMSHRPWLDRLKAIYGDGLTSTDGQAHPRAYTAPSIRLMQGTDKTDKTHSVSFVSATNHIFQKAGARSEQSETNIEEQAHMAANTPEVAWRVAALAPQVPTHGPIGRLLARTNTPTVNALHHCSTCGDPLGSADGRYRCKPCQFALWIVLNTPHAKRPQT